MQDRGMKEKSEDPIPTVRDLYPAFSEEELREAEVFWNSYLNLALRIHQRIHGGSEQRRRLGILTSPADLLTMKGERSKNNTRIL